MDLHFTADTATEEERAAVDALLGAQAERETRASRNGHAQRERRHLLLPALHAVQDRIGWISRGAMNYVSERLSVPPAETYGVATFYALFFLKPRPPVTVHVCDDIACLTNDADGLSAAMKQQFGGDACVPSACLGLCDRAPAALVLRAGRNPEAHVVAANGTHVGGSDVRLLRRAGKIDPESLEEYRASGGFTALERARELGSDGIIASIAKANLVGRGGAAFPTARKMEAVAKEPAQPRYLICNADESEPGTFKDRVLMESDPFAVVESMAIAAHAIGCEHAFVYIRGEYPLARKRIENAIAKASEAGLLGSLEIEVRRGAGAYICGEETALFNSIEGKRGEPRNKPPFPAQHGLFGKPTLVNNVETLVCIPEIILNGSANTKLFCVSGTVTTPGVYEVPFGTTLRDVIELAGGVRDGRALRAILLGGAAGFFVGPESLDLQLSFEATRAAGVSLGSGVIMLFDDTVDLSRIVHRIARFFRDESCGQCVPCRVGTVRQEEALARGDITALNDIARVMRDASICGLGQTAAGAVISAVSLNLLNGSGR